MSIYTYVVDHGDETPGVNAGDTVINGKVLAVQFNDALAEIEALEELANRQGSIGSDCLSECSRRIEELEAKVDLANRIFANLAQNTAPGSTASEAAIEWDTKGGNRG